MAKKRNKYFRILALCLGLIGLLLVRASEEFLFHDPLHVFYKSDYLTQSLPDFNRTQLLGSMLMRYVLNSAFSIVIIYMLFPKKTVLSLCFWIYGIFALLGFCLFIGAITYFPDRIFEIFYLRRFLIHPVLLLVLVPGLYYQKTIGLKNS